MKKRLLFILCLILGLSGLVSAQTKTVTNADLEKFRQQRLKSEKDYQENYQRLGLPSPEELEERNKKNIKELIEFSEKLRAERLENERIEALEAQINAVEEQNGYLQTLNTTPRVEQNYYLGYLPLAYYGGYSTYSYGRGNYYNNRWRNYNNRWGNYNRRHNWGNRMPPIRPPRPIRPSFPLVNPYFPPVNRRRR